MLKKYELFLQGNEDKIVEFMDALRQMDKNYYVCKEEFNLHKGCRKNWFPLVLLNKGLKNHQHVGHPNLEVRVQIHNFVNKLASCNYYHSFYVEKFGKMTSETDSMRVLYKANDDLNDCIKFIADCYGLTYYIQKEDKSMRGFYKKYY